MTDIGFTSSALCEKEGHCTCWGRVGYCCKCDTEDQNPGWPVDNQEVPDA